MTTSTRKRCGKPTKSGAPCRLYLSGGKCPTHDCDLSARNRKVVQACRASDPEGFSEQRVRAGKAGFLATGGKHGWERAHEAARLWRLDHPSEPERWAMDVLAAAGYTDYEREYRLPDGFSVDFVFHGDGGGAAVEINGHQHKPSFGELTPRAAKQARKVQTLNDMGFAVHVVNAAEDRDREATMLLDFLRIGVS